MLASAGVSRTARPEPPGRSLDSASNGGARGMTVTLLRARPRGLALRRGQNSAYGLLRCFNVYFQLFTSYF